MKIHEYQAKQLLRDAGIPTPAWMTGAPTTIRKYDGLGHYPYIEDEQALFPDLSAFFAGELDGELRRTVRAKPDYAPSR